MLRLLNRDGIFFTLLADYYSRQTNSQNFILPKDVKE